MTFSFSPSLSLLKVPIAVDSCIKISELFHIFEAGISNREIIIMGGLGENHCFLLETGKWSCS